MREHEHEIREAGVNLAAIGLGDQAYARLFREETGISFPLLIDADRQAYKAAQLKKGNLLHLLRRDNARARARARMAGLTQHKLGKDPFQLGGTFVFGPGDQDLFAHVSQTFGDTAAVEDALNSLRGK